MTQLRQFPSRVEEVADPDQDEMGAMGTSLQTSGRAAAGALSYLDDLEAEAIEILREVVAQVERPVMLYSIGKDSSAMLQLARKAFYPGKLPFPLLHIDTTWKFREMYAFRDEVAAQPDVELLVHVNQNGLDDGVGPFTHDSSSYTDVMKTESLRQALDLHRFDAAIGGARRDEERSRAKERIFSFRDRAAPLGPEEPAARALASLQRAQAPGRVDPRLPAVELDRARRVALHLPRADSDRPALPREGAAGGRARADA